MYIGKAAQLSGTTIKAIRHYEAIGLMPAPARQGGYRVYTEQSVERLMFIKCAQQLGFKLKELQEILLGYEGDALPWDRAEQAIADKKRTLAAQIAVLQQMQAGLIEFETQLKGAQGDCSSLSSVAI
ncbi:MerR family transcriptional regulator [Pseudomonas sp. FDAARGOS_380]|jgi:DNA-binding transcriptional MerR regulator|uniref:MerR family transcriptional regulator n=1 Tax=unclassified Pseudomonas TaxID=196821 RepID=UPI000519A7B5|nr:MULTISPECIES: MerR family transcriptional regulator [unclassified Pseudomonas]ATN10397.1 MerR family transcriptional regulator [Pseudomonas sp. FDAARGOS_380]NMX29180.1 MerR family transcriptional regulator [Pseudomonas sp. WS 5406]WLH23606.1 MerR family transcriptional regulator [Pseudomonas sp. FP215]